MGRFLGEHLPASLLLIAVGMTSTSHGRESATNDSPTWRVARTFDVPQDVSVTAFYDSSFGVSGGPRGDVYYSTDGGTSFAKAHNGSQECRLGIDVPSAKLAWHVGGGGAPGVSEDGGRTWQAVSKLPYTGHSMFVSFVDRDTGWVASNCILKMWSTRDGGQSWREVSLPQNMAAPHSEDELVTISLVASGYGYVLDTTGTLHKTVDDGQSWIAVTLPPVAAPMKPIVADHAAAIRFVDAKRGVIALGIFGNRETGVMVGYTDDGGASWREETLPVSGGKLYLNRAATVLTVSAFDHPQRVTVLER